MYESYWQLRCKPFENDADPQFYFPGETHQAALLKLRYAVENRRGGALLAGPAGTGKTFIVGMLRNLLGERCRPLVHLVYPQMSAAELLGYLADEFEGSPTTTTAAVHESVRRIEHFLAENLRQDRHALVIVDEAHLIESGHTFETLRLLLNFGVDGRPGLTLVLAGQTGLLPMLDRMPQLEERMGVKCLLRPFSVQETAAYVNHRLQTAGARQAIVEPEAFATLYELTHGIARQINRLCDLALLIGYAEERHRIDAAHFEAVCRELVSVVPE